MEKAFKKLKVVTEIYKKRTENLAIYYSQGNCAPHFHTTHLDVISGASNDYEDANIQNINSASLALEEQNKQARRYSCALIY